MKNFTLNGLFTKVAPSTRKRRFTKARQKRAFTVRRSIEVLEDRLAPAVFMVNTLADTVDTDPAVTSLRDAITAADTQGGDDIINFSVTGTINLTGRLGPEQQHPDPGPRRRQFDGEPRHRRQLPHLHGCRRIDRRG